MKTANKRRVKITAIPDSGVPEKILLQRFCLLRFCEKVGDSEVINNTQLGRLREHGVGYEVME